MSGAGILTMDGTMKTLPPEAVASLDRGLEGRVAVPGTPEWERSRTVWNAMIDRRPGLVIRCASARDVQRAVRFAAAHDLLAAVRGGGHNIAGNAVCEGGLQIDLSAMKAVMVDASARRARAEPGATLADLDAATQPHGLATPVGVNSTTGIAGLTLGGGFGWLSRRHGMTIDNLVAVEIVTADGELRVASATENADLFWAVRGGGGNFGVVTAFEYALHPVGPEITAGFIVHPLSAAGDVLRAYRDVAASASDDLVAWALLRKAPPLPFLPEEVHGTEVLVLACFWGGAAEDADAALAPLKDIGDPIAVAIGPAPYAEWQQVFDPLLVDGARNYWKSHDFTGLSDAMIELLIGATRALPGPHCEIFVAQLGGAVNRVPADATAYPHRDAEYVMNVHARWETPEEDEACVAWARAFHKAAAPHATGGVYVNFQPQDELGDTHSAYGSNHTRLARIKAMYDPDNRFRVNQNIEPLRVAGVV